MARTGGAHRGDSFESTRQQLSDIEVNLPGGSIQVDESQLQKAPTEQATNQVQQQPTQVQQTQQQQQIKQDAQQRAVEAVPSAKQASTIQVNAPAQQQMSQPPVVDMSSQQPQASTSMSSPSGYENQSSDVQLSPLSISSPVFSSQQISNQRSIEKAEADAAAVDAEPTDTNVQELERDEDTQPQSQAAEDTHPISTESEVTPMPLNDAPPTSRARSAQKQAKKESLERVKNKSYSGTALQGKVMGSLMVKPEEIGIGGAEIDEALRLGDTCGLMRYLDSLGIDTSTISNADDMADIVNGKMIPAATTKSPVNSPSSAQVKMIKILKGIRGFFLHPIMSKSYNADFDGDEINVSFDESAIKRYKNTMSYMLDLDGSVLLDPDFFITANIEGPYSNEESAVDFFKSRMSYLNLDELDLSKLIDSLRELYAQHSSSEALGNLSKVISDISDKSKDRYHQMSEILNSVYDAMRVIQIAQAELNSHNSNVSLEDMLPVRNNHDRGLLEVVDGLIDGSLPANFQDFKVALTAYAGEGGEGENIQFRFNSDILKMFRLDDRIYRGEEDLFGIYEHTMKYAMAKKCSNAVFSSNDAQVASDLIRTEVISRVGYPTASEPFNVFLHRFVAEYNEWACLINIANTTFSNDMSISSEDAVKQIKSGKCGDIAAAFVDIYGDCSIATLFGNVEFVESDRNNSLWIQSNRIRADINDATKTLRQVARCNRVTISQDEMQKKLDISMDAPNAFEGLIYSIYDQKNSAAAKYSTDMFGLDVRNEKAGKSKDTIMDKLHSVIGELASVGKKQIDGERIVDYQSYIDDLIDLINSVGPDVFSHFEMYDNSFFDSEYGKKILNANNADELGNIFLTMQFDMRIDRMRAAMDKCIEANESEIASTSDVMKAVNEFYKESDSLADSSYVWSAIVKEINSSDNSAYKILSENELRTKNLKHGATKNAPEYWTNPKHEGVVDMMLDTSFPIIDKCNVLSDIVRHHENFSDIRSWEMPYQLMLDNGNSWSDRPPTSVSIFDASRDFDRRFSRFNRRTLAQEEQQARQLLDLEPGEIQTALEAMSIPGNMIEIPEGLYADALMVSIDKEYDQAEKTGTTASASALFEALSQQHGGDIMHDVYRTDDRVLGMIAVEKMSGMDVAQILSGKRTVMAYDRTGAVGLLSRDTITGVENASNADVQKYLANHPRVASALVRSRVGVGSDGAYLQGLESPKESMRGLSETRKMNPMPTLMNHPGFGAIVAVLTGTNGEVSRNMRSRYINNAKAVSNMIVDLVEETRRAESENEMTILDYASIVDSLGLSKEAIDATGYNEADGENLRNLVIGYLEKYVNELKASNMPLEKFTGLREDTFQVDVSSLYAFFDTRQELNRAKISASTGVEGTETFQLALWMSFLSPKDRYTLPSLVEEEDYEKFVGCMTSTGEPFDLSMIDRPDTDEIVVECPDGYTVKDKTIDRAGQQISSASAYFIIKRDKGAEANNMKAAKRGDDGLDSIIKHTRFSDTVYSTLREELDNIAKQDEASGLMMARYRLAEILKEANEAPDLNYTELDMANYMCLAELMLINGEDGLVLRSLEQIAAAIKWRMPSNVIDNANIDELKSYAAIIANECGSRNLDTTMALDGISRPAPILKDYKDKFAKRKVSSSFDRNFDLLKRIKDAFKKNGHSLIGKERASVITKNNLKKLGINMRERHPFMDYDVLGIIGDKEIHTSPGPRSLWVIEDNSSDIEIALKNAKGYGITVAVNRSVFRAVPSEYYGDFIEFPGANGYYMLPFFDMKLNGSRLSPSDGRMGIFQAGRDAVSWGVESQLNEYGLGDSGFKALKHMTDTMSIHYDGVESRSIEDLFPNLDDDSSCTFGWPDKSVIEECVINKFQSDIMIDYGVNENSPDYETRKHEIDLAIERYAQAYGSANEHGTLPKGKPGDIIGWVYVESSKPGQDVKKAIAPVIVFERKDSGSVPTSFDVNSISWGVGNHSDITGIQVSWTYNDGLDGHYVKMYEGAGCANKMLGMIESDVDLYLRNGIPLDYVYPYETTKSRRGGTNRRIKTMETLMFALRCDEDGYNFAADSEKSFPDNPELKELLSTTRIDIQDWPDLDTIRWHDDPKINAFLKKEIKLFADNGGNPSDYLANRFGNETTNVMWEFEYMFEQNLMYEDFMLRYIHSMRPNLVPNGIEDTSDGYIFRVSNESGMNKGCLQMEVPHESVLNPGTYFYTWENVFAGYTFFGQEFSGFHRPNINGASQKMEALNTMALSGRTPSKKELTSMLKWSTRDMGKYNGPITLTWDGNMNTSDGEIEDA